MDHSAVSYTNLVEGILFHHDYNDDDDNDDDDGCSGNILLKIGQPFWRGRTFFVKYCVILGRNCSLHDLVQGPK